MGIQQQPNLCWLLKWLSIQSSQIGTMFTCESLVIIIRSSCNVVCQKSFIKPVITCWCMPAVSHVPGHKTLCYVSVLNPHLDLASDTSVWETCMHTETKWGVLDSAMRANRRLFLDPTPGPLLSELRLCVDNGLQELRGCNGLPRENLKGRNWTSESLRFQEIREKFSQQPYLSLEIPVKRVMFSSRKLDDARAEWVCTLCNYQTILTPTVGPGDVGLARPTLTPRTLAKTDQ